MQKTGQQWDGAFYSRRGLGDTWGIHIIMNFYLYATFHHRVKHMNEVSLRSTPGGSLSAIAMQLSEMRCTFGREFKTSNNLNCQHNSRFWIYYKRIEVVCCLPLHVLCWWKSVQKSYQALSIRFDGWHHILQARWPSFDAMRLHKLLRYGGFTSVLSIIWNCTVAW